MKSNMILEKLLNAGDNTSSGEYTELNRVAPPLGGISVSPECFPTVSSFSRTHRYAIHLLLPDENSRLHG